MIFFSKIAPILGGYDPADYYFVGALIALSCAIFSAANNIVIALVKQKYRPIFIEYNLSFKDSSILINMSYHYYFQLGNGVSTSVQLLWMGIVAILVAGLSEFVDDNDRFFTPNIGEITAFEWGICIGIAFIGKSIWL